MHLLHPKNFHTWRTKKMHFSHHCAAWVNLHKLLVLVIQTRECASLKWSRKSTGTYFHSSCCFFHSVRFQKWDAYTLLHAPRHGRRGKKSPGLQNIYTHIYKRRVAAFRLSSCARNFTRITERSLFAQADWHMVRRICKNSIWPCTTPISISALSHFRPTFVANVPYLLPPAACTRQKKMHERACYFSFCPTCQISLVLNESLEIFS